MSDLQPITPHETKQWYLDSRAPELSESTVKAHKYRLSAFIRYCDEMGIGNMNDLSGRHFDRYKMWRREEGDLNNVTLNTQLSTLRVFIKWAEGVDAVPHGMHEYITPPSMATDEDVRKVILDSDDAADLLRYLRKFEYASRNHALIELMWHSGMRTGALRAIDLGDLDDQMQSIYLKHRPETDTPLKNGKAGERVVYVKDDVWGIIEDYRDLQRVSQVEDSGREPLFTTKYGRLSVSALRRQIYELTCPCYYTGSCPHDRDMDTCEARQDKHCGAECPSSVSPHSVRKGSITWARLNEVPIEAVSERMDVSPSVLKKHYDQRTPEQEMESRRRYFEDL